LPLVLLAEKNSIPFTVDVYPFCSSDGSVALRAGNDLRVALIRPGVAASGIQGNNDRGEWVWRYSLVLSSGGI